MVEPERVESIFHEARAIGSPSDRRAFLERACDGDDALRARVDALLGAHDGAGAEAFLHTADLDPSASRPRDEDAPRAGLEGPGTVIDRYELVEKLGEGGFGAVFEALQTRPMSRRVALKIVKAGMDTRQVLARFEVERQAVAMMDHPCIARVFDAGATAAGRPYFVMELVRGTPITAYADEHDLAIRDRIELFRQVCAAVQHAHQKGVIHRDIKPSNVLVTEVDGAAVPKVIDFGISKATGGAGAERTIVTQAGLLVGTPQYMSPEQARLDEGDVDTRSDVYSLGILLYELLTGSTPIRPEQLRGAGLGEIQRLIAVSETPRPSTRVGRSEERTPADRGGDAKRLALQLRGDLDWIILKALDRDRARRYDTVQELSADLRRFLDHEPVSARPPSAVYRARKLVRKHRVAVVTMLIVTAALVAGIVGTSTALVWALRTKAELAETNVALDRIVEFQSSRMGEIDPQRMGIGLRVDVVEEARSVMTRAGLSPEEVASGVAQLQGLLAGTNFTSIALDALDRSIFGPTQAVIDRDFAGQPLMQADLLQSQAVVLTELGMLDRALELQERALAIRRELLGDDDERTLASIAGMGILLRDRGAIDEAEPHYRAALEGRLRVLGEDHPLTLDSINGMGAIAFDRQRLDEAETFFRRSMEAYRRLHGPTHPGTLRAAGNLGALREQQLRLEEAEGLYRTVYEGFRATRGDDDTGTMIGAYNLALVLRKLERLGEAEMLMQQAVEGLRRVLGDDHPQAAMAINGLGALLHDQGRTDEAIEYVRAAMESNRRVLGDRNLNTLASISNMGALLRTLDEHEEAEQLGAESVSGARLALPDGHWVIAVLLMQHARTLAVMDRFDEAAAAVLEANAILTAARGEADAYTLESVELLAEIHEDWHEAEPDEGHDAEARQWRSALESGPATGGAG